jgi:YesN/AraC family two-component response regulator
MAGHEVDEAADGEEAIEYFLGMPYDVVVSDINTPVKDGVESLLDLKTDYPDIKFDCHFGRGRVAAENG